MSASEHQEKVRRAMEGNIAAYFHPFEERVAFLYPSGQVTVCDSTTFEQLDELNVNKWDENGVPVSRAELVKRADVKMTHAGYDRKGRVQEA